MEDRKPEQPSASANAMNSDLDNGPQTNQETETQTESFPELSTSQDEAALPPSEDVRRPRRATGNLSLRQTMSNLRRRSTRRTNRSRTMATEAGQSTFGLAGPEETSQLRRAQEPYVHPGYADLNPSYEQPANSRPVWSLAKPLPRVVRESAIPTEQEILENRVNPELPGENSQKAGVDVDPNDLEKGNLQLSKNPTKIAAQLEDARLQRETNFLNALGRRRTYTRTGGMPLSGSQTAVSGRRRRASTMSALPEDPNASGPSAVDEGHPSEEQTPVRPAHRGSILQPIQEGTEQLQPVSSKSSEASSMTTLGPEDDQWANDMDPLMGELPEDEIHNVHTIWSVIRIHHREFLAELLAVVVQLTLGFCSDLATTLGKTNNPDTTAWAWGFATMIGIYISGGISGAHLNPTITAMLWFFRGFPKRKMPEYWLAQYLGAFIAAFVTYGLYLASIKDYLETNPAKDIVESFVTSQRETYIDAATGFFNEFVGTAILAIAILSLGDDQNAPPGAGMNAFIIGLVITMLNYAFAFQTGIAANPSRDFGPRLALLTLGYGKELFTNPYWFYGPWAGTLCGAFVGGTLHDVAIFTGGESPINYPWVRTKRAAYKSKQKWKKRLHLPGKEE